MKLFISWSGQKSELVALELRIWLSSLFQSLDIWISKKDIPAGAQWYPVLNKALSDADFGIVCVTKENINSAWILFEAGAISKAIGENRLVPLLIDLKKSELTGPLSFFQSITFDKAELYHFILEISQSNQDNFRDPKILDLLFENLWNDFQQKIAKINEISYPRNKDDFTIIYSRELSVLILLEEGKRASEIARELFLSPKTVETYIKKIKEKLGARNIEEAIKFAKYYELI